ncbi:uncharacterized protein (TIGR02302 family) [Rhodobacteraceae bacterium MBR-64]
MTEPDRSVGKAASDKTVGGALYALRRTIGLTRAGLVAERAARAFWPLWSLVLLVVALLALGVQGALTGPVLAGLGGLVGGLAVVALWYGVRRFRWPSVAEARDRLDHTLPGRPIAALTDHQVIGTDDGASKAVWRAHLERMAARARAARPVRPDLRLASRDRFALRYVGLTALVMALLFGSIWRVASVRDMLPGGPALASGPSWEGWIEPPRHTGLPTLYLNEIKAGTLAVPVGSAVTLRLYGEVGALSVEETVSGQPLANSPADEPMVRQFDVARPGALRITGANGRAWQVDTIPDTAPAISFAGDMVREAGGRARQDFRAIDDYGVTGVQAEISLDPGAVDRRHGLAANPEPRDPITVDLPLPVAGDRKDFTESLIDDFSQHPWANLPVRITLRAVDAAGATSTVSRAGITLPGRRFFDPLAAAVIEMRRDLLWARANGPRSAQILRAVTHLPEGFVRDHSAYLQLRVAMRRLDAGNAASGGLSVAVRDEVAAALWDIALQIEEGDLASALERLRRAQDRLSEAIRNGADKSEIAELMQELREATQDYIRQLAEDAARNPDRQQADNQNTLQLSQDQLQQMLQRLQELMEQGRTAEAAELLEQLRQLMENLQVTQGQGEGQQGPGEQAMRDLADTLRQQQGLSDEAFQNLQDRFGQGGSQPEGQQPGQQGMPGQPGGQEPGRSGEGPQGTAPGGETGQSLAERQQALREQLRRQQEQGLPFAGTQEGDAVERGLNDAARAMDKAERALRGQNLAEALDHQSRAMEALRESLRNLGEAMARNQQPGQGQQGQAMGDGDPRGDRDPLGRSIGRSGRIGTDEQLLQGEDVYRRAEELLDEIRRRSGDQTRPEAERDYLRRLLDRF